MPKFPKREAEVVALAESLWRGLWANNTLYPNPPVHSFSLRIRTLIYRNRRDSFLAKKAEAEQAVTTKDGALEDLVEAVKANIRYAENTVDYNNEKLKLIGWAGKKVATPLAPPGQARLLEAPKQGKGWVFLDWKAPVDGGKPAAYKVMRRERPAGAWEEVATAVITEATLVEQPQRIELEYRVIAVNKADEGEPSNTVMVVL